MSTTWKAERGAHRLEGSQPVQWLGRFGDACYGVVHLVVAWLALQIAFGDKATEADQRGAVTTIAAQPFGSVLLWMVAIGLIAFGIWQLLAAATGFGWVAGKRKRTMRRLSAAGRAVVVLAIAAFTLRMLTGQSGGSGSGGSGSGQQEMTARLLALPAGRVLVIVIGLGVVAAAVLSGRRGVRKTFLEDLDLAGVSTGTRSWVRWLGMVGYVAKGVAYLVIGVLLCTAGIHVDPSRAGGLDKALRTLAAQPFGIVLLVAVAIGFAAFGVYSFADARWRRG
jgi:uncharacterized protein DUF1206